MVDAGEWRKITPEALLPHQDQPAWDQKPTAPFVMRLGDRLRMYYDGRLRRPNKVANEVRIGFAEASVDDPLTWTKHERNPVFDVSEPGGFDSEWVSYPWVVPITGHHWHMYYAGFGGEYRREGTEKTWRTALAESDDAGLTWRRSGNGPIFEHGIAGSPHEGCSGSCAVLRVGDEYWMYYTAVADREEYERGLRITIALAVSTDGGHTFSPHEAGAVVAPDRDNPIETYVTSKPTVQLRDGVFRMWYSSAGPTYRVRYAESEDGIVFRSDPRVVVPTSESGWDSGMTEYAMELELPGRSLLYYCGNEFSGIGAAERVR